MNHWIVAPVVLPGLMAAFLVLALRHNLPRQRLASIASTVVLVAMSIGLFALSCDGETRAYALGNWPAPFGIVMVLDRLSALMLVLTSILALAVALYASDGWDERGRHFHALFQFQLMGICGAFMTGDVFNLFVFFEVMLIASYGLMLHGGGGRRLRAGFHYVAINLIGSTLFLFAVGLIYAVTGTLNMADLAEKAAQTAPGDVALLKTGVMLLFVVFALKAALVPLHWWLPTTYAAAPAPTAALFAIMTKVGAYSILRVHTMVFGVEAGAVADVAQPWIVPAALATLAVGAAGVLETRRITDLAAFAVVWSMGSLLVAIGLFEPRGIAAALYYTAHSTVAGAALFLLADLICRRRGALEDRLELGPPMAQPALMAMLFFVAAIAMAGLPPLSGFIGKLLILDAARGDAGVWIWGVILVSSLVVIIGFARAGSLLFWKSETVPATSTLEAPGPASMARTVLALGGLLALTAGLSVFAGPASDFFAATSAQIGDPSGYVRGVLGGGSAAGMGR